MGKGSGRRPTFISEETYQQNYDRTFGVKPTKARYIPPPLDIVPAFDKDGEPIQYQGPKIPE